MGKSIALLALGLVALAATACGGGGGATTPSAVGEEQPSQAKVGTGVGDLAPTFAVTTTAGQSLSLADMQGRPFVLYFFATW